MKQLLVGLLLMLGHISLRANSPSPFILEIDSLRMEVKEEKKRAPDLLLYFFANYQNIHKKISRSAAEPYPLEAQYHFYFKEVLPHLDQLLSAITTKQERQYFFSVEAPILEGALKVAHQLYQKTKDRQYLQDAFDLMEKQKFPSRQLPSLLPKALSSQLRHLDGQILALEDSIQYFNQPDMRMRKSQLQQQLSSVHHTIRNQHPEYAAFLSLHQMVSLSDFQQLLAPEEAVLQYFLGDQAIYALVIRKDQVGFKVTPIASKSKIKAHLDFYLNGLQEPALYKSMVPAAHELYQLLLSPLETQLSSIEKITVIPDVALQAIPFETFLKQLPKKFNFDYAKLDYLIWHYQFAYNRSATQMAQHLSADSIADKAPRIVAFAPGFDQQLHRPFKANADYQKDQAYLALDSLTHLTQNLDWLKSHLGATTYKWQEATVAKFKEHSQADILHLGTHIIFDPDFLMESKIVLAKDLQASGSLGEAYLSLKDLHELQLDMDFAVLAGCASGKDGFGFAYGFESAGISSTLYSLWKINEEESAHIIQLFYEHLQNGIPKGEALHLAKKDYLTLAKDIKLAPKYWAAFVLNGNPQAFAFETPKQENPYPILGSIGAFFLGLILYLRKRLKIT